MMKIVPIFGVFVTHVVCEISFQNCVLRHTRTNEDMSTDHVISCGLTQNSQDKKTSDRSSDEKKNYNKIFTRLKNNEQNSRKKRNVDGKEFCYKTESYENLEKKLKSCRPEQIIERRIKLKIINKCLYNNGGCGPDGVCTSFPPGEFPSKFGCECKAGYKGSPPYCKDVNECKVNRTFCGNNSICLNTPGSFKCKCEDGYEGNPPKCEKPFLPFDCLEIKQKDPSSQDGVYTIYPDIKKVLKVYCDMRQGGWTVIQRRLNGLENFNRSFVEYENGFGSSNEEYWLGLAVIRKITNENRSELKIELEDFNNERRTATYNFSIGAEPNYKLNVKNYSGNAGNAMRIHDNRPFSAFDRDMDSLASDNCARERGGGWWYFSCGYSNLNGVYYKNESRVEKWRGLLWFQWKGAQKSLKRTTMMVKRIT